MHIGIDARFLTHPQRGGFKTYTTNLVRAIQEVDDENQYLIYVDRPLEEGLLLGKNNVEYRVVRADVPVIGMPFREQISLRRQVKNDDLDLVHFLCNTAPVGLSSNYVLTLHDTIQIEGTQLSKSNFAIKNWMLAQYSKWAIFGAARKANKVIAVSSFEKKKINQILNVPSERIQVVLEAPNPIYFYADHERKKEWSIELQIRYGVRNKYILTVGYELRKNIPLLITAFSILKSEFADLDLVIVASNEEMGQYFRKLAGDLAISDRVNVLGKVSDQDLIKLYNLAEIFVFPSEREGFGLPPLEAIACGTPTIAMNMSSMPEVLRDGALFVDTKDPEVWAQAIKRVMSDDELRAGLISKGLKRAAEFSWQKCARETIQVYRQVYEESQ